MSDFENEQPNEYIEGYDADEDFEEDAYSEVEEARATRREIGLGILQDMDADERDNIEFLNVIYQDYYVELPTVMAYASERLVDLFCVGEVYLTPLFRSETTKYQYIMKKLREYDNLSGKNIRYDEKLILAKVYNLPNDYIKPVLKYLYTKDEYEIIPAVKKVESLFDKIRRKLDDKKYITNEEREKYKALYNDVLDGARATNLAWLMGENKQRAIRFADISTSDGLDTSVTTVLDENFEIIYHVRQISKILNQSKISLNDKEKLDRSFERLNSYVVLARNLFVAEREFNVDK